jgi:inorganic pyrophosphatase
MAGDGDPLDALVMVESPSFTGCVIEVRAIGMLVMWDQGKEDLKVLCVPTRDPRTESIHNYTQLHPHRLREIEHFFVIYKELEGKQTETSGWRDAEEARRAVVTAYEQFKSIDKAGQ